MGPNEGEGRDRPPRGRDRLRGLHRAIESYVEDKAVRDEGSVTIGAEPLARLLEISRSMYRIHDRRELLAYVSGRLRELFDAQNSFVILFDKNGEARIQTSHLADPGGDSSPISATILEQVRTSRDPIIIDDTRNRPDLRDQTSVEMLKIKSVLCTPLIVEEKVIGALQFDHRGESQPFPVGDLRILSLFADQVATAFHNLELIEQVNQALKETQEAQERVVQTERLAALGEMAGGITHDFNNTLFIALGLCDVLLDKKDIAPEIRSSLERVQTCALDAAKTVRRLQSFSHGESGEERHENVDPRDVVKQMPELTRNKWSDDAQRRGVGIELSTRLDATLPVSADPSEIREVLTNMIFNAVDSMERDGKITLTTGLKGIRSFISVTDDGVGMSAATKARVFEPFYTTKGARGHGFGLSTSWNIARRLGGEITVESEPGKGSTFTLWIPSTKVMLKAASEGEVPTVRHAHVLVVDDDPEVLSTLEELLGAGGHTTVGFTEGAKALRALDSDVFDVVVTDLGMPGMNGSEVALAVKAAQPDLPVIILTGWGSDIDLDETAARGISAVLAKPIRLSGLNAALARALEN